MCPVDGSCTPPRADFDTRRNLAQIAGGAGSPLDRTSDLARRCLSYAPASRSFHARRAYPLTQMIGSRRATLRKARGIRRIDNRGDILVRIGRFFCDAAHRWTLDENAPRRELIHNLAPAPGLHCLTPAYSAAGAVTGGTEGARLGLLRSSEHVRRRAHPARRRASRLCDARRAFASLRRRGAPRLCRCCARRRRAVAEP